MTKGGNNEFGRVARSIKGNCTECTFFLFWPGYYKDRFSCLWVGTSEGGVGYYERYGFVQDHVVKNFFTDNYPEPIIDNGRPCVDMTLLRLEIR